MVINLFYVSGIIGLILITVGIFIDIRKKQNILCLIGGALLIIYSIYINDLIFIILESVFTLIAAYNLLKLTRKKK